MPGDALLDGAAILFGGALLLTPGVLTDFLGLSLLLPGTRRWMARRIRGWLLKQVESGQVQWTVVGGGTGFGTGFGSGPGFPGAGDAQGRPGTRVPDDDDEAGPPIPGLDPRNEIRGG
jgi:UPF0716 family protein affecting phage T7 exclusion